MKLGLLWYDNDPKKTLDLKLAEAATRYKEKFGAEPSVCYVNPAQMDAPQAAHGKFKLVGAAAVLPNHIWLEIEK